MCFFEICCDAVQNMHCYQFQCKDLKVSPWKIFSEILWIWLSLVKLHSLEFLKVTETRTLANFRKIFNSFSTNFSLMDKPGSWFLLAKCLKNTCGRVTFQVKMQVIDLHMFCSRLFTQIISLHSQEKSICLEASL